MYLYMLAHDGDFLFSRCLIYQQVSFCCAYCELVTCLGPLQKCEVLEIGIHVRHFTRTRLPDRHNMAALL